MTAAVACGSPSASSPSPSPAASPSAAPSPSPTSGPVGLTFPIAPAPPPTTAAAGTIIVTPQQGSTMVELKIQGLQPASSHIAHIHFGSCQQRGNIALALDQVVADQSGNADVTSTISAQYPPPSGTWYVVVHAGPDMQGSNSNYLLCGNLFK